VNRQRIAAAFIALIFTYQILTGTAYCQSFANEGKTVTAINVKGNKAISAETVLSKLRTKVGDKFSQEALNEDLKRLYATQYFTDVSIDVSDHEGGAAVTFVVEEKSVIEDIVFTGNKVFTAQKLKAAMKSKPNEMLNLALLVQDISEIKAMYIKKGYPTIDVKYTADLNKDTNKATINIAIDESTRVTVKAVNITGNKLVKTGAIRKILGTKPAWLFNPGVFMDDLLQEDTEKIKAMYDDLGYLDAQAIARLDYSDGGKVLNITIEIEEGKPYLVGDIKISGDLVFPEKDVRKNIKMMPGKPFSSRALRDDVVSIRQYYYNYGYMNSVIDIERNLNQSTGRIDLTYTIDPKEVVYVGKVEVKGNLKTKDIVVRRELRIYPGEKYNGAKMRRSKERIYNLGFFENVSFETEPTEVPNVQNLIVNVKESKTGEFSFGGGYSSIDMLVGFAEITQRNFDILNWPYFTGGGQSLSIKAEVGMVRNNYNMSWTDPWIFGYPFLFGFDLYRASHTRKEDLGWAYDEARMGGDARIGKEFTENLRGDLTYKLEEVKISNMVSNASIDLQDEVGTNWISTLIYEMAWDTRDNVFSPTKGYVVSGSIQDAGGIFAGDKDFIKGSFGASYYHKFFEKVVMELKGRGGLADSYGSSSEVPVYERFYAGGANTIRGYKERRVGPRDPGSNEPIGGEAILLANVEVTFPLYENMLKGAVFYDIGNVWRRYEDFMVGGNYRAGVGVGVRIKTPVGPVRLDYGYPLNGNYDDEKTGEFYFSMSRGF
jgi:outer membrane protein insertion porin family